MCRATNGMLAWNVVAGPCPDVPFDGYNRAMNSRYTFMVIIAPALPHRRGLLRLIAAPAIYVWKQVRIGKAHSDGQFDLVWASEEVLRPSPFPDYRWQSEWRRRVTELLESNP